MTDEHAASDHEQHNGIELPAPCAGPMLCAFGITLLFVGIAGLAGPGTLYAAMTARARGRDAMLPLLLFPLVIPIVLASVKGTHLVFFGDPMGQLSGWLRLSIAFDVFHKQPHGAGRASIGIERKSPFDRFVSEVPYRVHEQVAGL
jgi:hypothetical protein